MTNQKIRNLLDLIPLFILTIYAIILAWTFMSNGYILQWQHIIALIVLPVNYLLFYWRHKIGVLALGLTLLLGVAGLLSYSPAITTAWLDVGKGNVSIRIFYGQPVFLLWILIHLLISGRYYVGILTKRYWQALTNNSKINFD